MRIPPQLHRAIPAISSAALLALAFPPANVRLLVFVALAPWLASLRDTTPRGARRSGFLFGFLFFLHQMVWLLPFINKWTQSLLLAMVPWLLTAVGAGLFYSLVAWLIRECWALKMAWLIPIVWAGIEAFRAYIPHLAFPWGTLAFPLWPFPAFVQSASVGTIFLVSSWAVIPSLILAVLVWPAKEESPATTRFGRQIFRMGLLFLAILMFSAARYVDRPTGQPRVFTLGQPGVDMAFTEPDEEERQLVQAAAVIAARATVQNSSLLILPEGFALGGRTLPPKSPFGAVPPVPVLFGGNRGEGDKVFQSAFAYDGKWQAADKTRLVIFGEYVPLRDNLSFLQAFRVPGGDLSPAQNLTTLDVAGMRVGAMLCFEGLFPDLAQRHGSAGAQALAVMAIDDWYEGTPAWDQLWPNSIWRSIESGLPVLRSAARGMTLATDARGDIITSARPGELAAIRVEVALPEKSDGFEHRFGYVWLCWLACAIVGASALRRRFVLNRGAASRVTE